MVGDVVCVAAEDGWVRTFDAADGAPLAELQLAPAVIHGTPFGGIARAEHGPVVSMVTDRECSAVWLSLEPELAVEEVVPIALSKAGRKGPYGIGCGGPIIVGDAVVSVTVEENITPANHLTALALSNGRVRWNFDNAKVWRTLAAEQKKTGSGFSGTWSWYCTPYFADGVERGSGWDHWG